MSDQPPPPQPPSHPPPPIPHVHSLCINLPLEEKCYSWLYLEDRLQSFFSLEPHPLLTTGRHFVWLRLQQIKCILDNSCNGIIHPVHLTASAPTSTSHANYFIPRPWLVTFLSGVTKPPFFLHSRETFTSLIN
jgi:hypothetical protein